MCQELSIAPQPYPSSLEYHPDYWLSSPSAEALNHWTRVIPLFIPLFPTIYNCNKLNLDFFFNFFFFQCKKEMLCGRLILNSMEPTKPSGYYSSEVFITWYWCCEVLHLYPCLPWDILFSEGSEYKFKVTGEHFPGLSAPPLSAWLESCFMLSYFIRVIRLQEANESHEGCGICGLF